MINMVILVPHDQPEADGSTLVCVECAKEQFLHVPILPDHHHLTVMIMMMSVMMLNMMMMTMNMTMAS